MFELNGILGGCGEWESDSAAATLFQACFYVSQRCFGDRRSRLAGGECKVCSFPGSIAKTLKLFFDFDDMHTKS